MFSYDIYAAVERFGRELNDIRRSAEERETAAKRDLDAETIAFQTRIKAIRERMIQLQQQMKACRQEEDAACEHQTEIEEAYEAAVQHRRKVSAFPNTQNMLDFRPVEDAPATPGKRLCYATPATKSIEKTVDFNRLYNNRDAKYKHRIVQAVTAAGSHLKGYAHNRPSAALPAVIEAFGVRVTGCDKDKAELNNERFKRALDEGYQVLKSAKRHNAPRNMLTGAYLKAKQQRETC
ncbi:hypothetical protein COL26b_013258 [Colletotrichum chrysophilum]|uniref:uncharacterized protein n=1 Tax=Colletotrichum chrysophilum TaxID=1836956 RepID=UPI002300693E|nr:uncharacterized protein COL26b_013258 [Colletotrichum chrysophilum]KAJ0362691.1 hypothetical protein COL26b_013258 [Colletotrichum chrysophilum]